MKKVAFKMFGETRMVPHVTFTHGKEDIPPKQTWDDELWIERGEDWYALDYYKREGKTVLIVERNDWLKAKGI